MTKKVQKHNKEFSKRKKKRERESTHKYMSKMANSNVFKVKFKH